VTVTGGEIAPRHSWIAQSKWKLVRKNATPQLASWNAFRPGILFALAKQTSGRQYAFCTAHYRAFQGNSNI